MTYNLTRTCKNCKNVDSFSLTKVESAFGLYDSSAIWKTPCTNCNSTECQSLGHQHPVLDKELLDIWGNDLELFLMDQDQELLLADCDYFPMLLAAIDESKYPKSKIDILIEAICVLLYDYTVSSDELGEQENNERESVAEKVRPELIKRKDRIAEAGDSVMDYIQEVVYPQIGIDI